MIQPKHLNASSGMCGGFCADSRVSYRCLRRRYATSRPIHTTSSIARICGRILPCRFPAASLLYSLLPTAFVRVFAPVATSPAMPFCDSDEVPVVTACGSQPESVPVVYAIEDDDDVDD